MHAYDAKSHGVKESEQIFDKSIGERVKLRRQKANDKADETGDEQLHATDMPDLQTEESANKEENIKNMD